MTNKRSIIHFVYHELIAKLLVIIYNIIIKKKGGKRSFISIKNMNFSKTLQQLRNHHQLSQEALAEKLHVSRQAVAKWESGQTMPDLTNLLVLSDLFLVSLDRLLKDQDDCQKTSITMNHSLSPRQIKFLLEAKQNTYAAGLPENDIPSRPKAHDLTYQEGSLLYMDTYLGSERFSGQEALWEDHIPLWTMNYCGKVIGEGFSGHFLKNALQSGINQNLVRGPELFSEGDFTYHCQYDGDMDWFQGYESIYYLNQKIYECYFHGGLVKD